MPRAEDWNSLVEMCERAFNLSCDPSTGLETTRSGGGPLSQRLPPKPVAVVQPDGGPGIGPLFSGNVVVYDPQRQTWVTGEACWILPVETISPGSPGIPGPPGGVGAPAGCYYENQGGFGVISPSSSPTITFDTLQFDLNNICQQGSAPFSTFIPPLAVAQYWRVTVYINWNYAGSALSATTAVIEIIMSGVMQSFPRTVMRPLSMGVTGNMTEWWHGIYDASTFNPISVAVTQNVGSTFSVVGGTCIFIDPIAPGRTTTTTTSTTTSTTHTTTSTTTTTTTTTT